MIQHVKAIYEGGVLKPLTPLDLKEDEIVSLSVQQTTEQSRELDEEAYLPLIAEEGDPNITWEEVKAVLAKLPGSLSEDFIRERDERF